MQGSEDKIILDLCGGTGAWSRPYKDAGYDVRLATLPDFDVTDWKNTWLSTLVFENLEKYYKELCGGSYEKNTGNKLKDSIELIIKNILL